MTIEKYVDGVTAFKAIDMNKPINSLERDLNSLKTLVNENVLENQSIIVPNISLSIASESLVELDNNEWVLATTNPLGIYHENKIYFAGFTKNSFSIKPLISFITEIKLATLNGLVK